MLPKASTGRLPVFHRGAALLVCTVMNCMSLRMDPIFTPLRYSLTKTVATKLPTVLAVHVMVPVMGLMVMGPDAAAGGNDSPWKKFVPSSVANIINENWETIKKFASEEDMTTRVAGMKFPKEGYDSK